MREVFIVASLILMAIGISNGLGEASDTAKKTRMLEDRTLRLEKESRRYDDSTDKHRDTGELEKRN